MAPKRSLLFGVPLGQWLAVLPIIAIVCAVLYPVFQHPRQGNHRFSCDSKMRQLGLAYVQYSQDYDQTFPSSINAAGNGWAGQLYQFVQSKDAYKCPDDAHDGNYISYAENRNIVGQPLKKFADLTATVALYEATTLNCDPSTLETVSTTGLTAPQDSTQHNPNTFALNFLLADGHVKMLTPGQVPGEPNAVPPKNKGAYAATFAIR